jgi:alginate O-acetyltransferase complex protein AlgI
MFDYYKTADLPFRMFRSMLTSSDIAQLSDGRMAALGLTVSDGILVVLGCILMLCVSLLGRKENIRKSLAKTPFMFRCALFSLTLLLVIVCGAYGTGYDAAQFLYNQV